MFKSTKLGLTLALSLILGLQTAATAQTDKKKEELDNSKITMVFGGKRLGIIAGRLSKERAQELNLGEKRAVLVKEVLKDSAADRAGLKAGDVIVELDGKAIESYQDLRRKLQEVEYGKATSLRIIRDKNPQQLSFTLDKSLEKDFYAFSYGAGEEHRKAFEKASEERKKALEQSREALKKHRKDFEKARAEGKADKFFFAFGRGRLGVSVQELTDQLGKYFGVEKDQGVLVSNVSEDSAASKAGLQAGDVIIEINGSAIKNSRDLRKEVSKIESGEARLIVVRNRQKIELRANLEAKPAPGENFNFYFPAEPAALVELENFAIPPIPPIPPIELKELKDLPEIHIPDFNFDFDADFVGDLDIYL